MELTRVLSHLRQFVWRAPKFLTSPLITTLALSAIAMATLPFTIGVTAVGLTLAFFVSYPHRVPANLLYEIAVLDLIVRDKLSRIFPSLKQTWWHQITPGLYLGGIPLASRNHLEKIKSLGVRHVLAILEADEAEKETFFSAPLKKNDWQTAGIEYRRISCPDMTPPSLEELTEAAAWLSRRIEAGETVYINCKAGRGRSAMMVIAHLIYNQGMALKEAIAFLLSIRSVVRFRPSQMEQLKRFEALHSRGR